MNKFLVTALIMSAGLSQSKSHNMDNTNTNTSLAAPEQLTLTQEWDKVFPKSEKVDHKKVTFVNRYGITLAADMYVPKGAAGQSRSSQAGFMLSSLQSVGILRLRLIRHLLEKAEECLAE